MKFSKFIINNYRAVKRIEIPISNTLIPIIGINESGKTSVLKGILAFDKLKDSYNKGEHLNFKNKYELGKQECSIEADVHFESAEEVDILAKKLKLNVGDKLHEILKECFTEGKSIRIARSLNEMKYKITNLECTDENTANKIVDLLPFILYFDDFSDRVPEKIEFPANYKEEPNKLNKKGVNAEWRSLIEEVFIRSTNGAYSLSDFLKIDENDEQDGLLSDVSDVLNKEIIEEWKKLKQKGRLNLVDDEEVMGLDIKFTPPKTKEKGYIFEFKVVDQTLEKRKRRFNITERSKGFQWYFNFIIKLKFNSKYKDNPSNAIYLLDEPGSYLHSSAQEELLKELKEISKENTLFYCTHSQYLLDPNVINVSSIKIALKSEAKVNVYPFSSYGLNKSQGALTPLLDALHLKTGLSEINTNNILITEGITDYYLLTMLMQWHREWENTNIKIIPGAGAANLKDLISIAIAGSEKYLVVLDNDSEGKKAFKRYSEFFGESQNPNFYIYENKERNFVLEDYIQEKDREEILKATGAQDIKSAITTLYFLEDKHLKERLIKKVDFTRLSSLKEHISNHFHSKKG